MLASTPVSILNHKPPRRGNTPDSINRKNALVARLSLSGSSFYVHRGRHNKLRDLFCDPIGGWHQCTTEMDIALRDAAGSMPQESGYRQFCETEFGRNASKGVPEDAWCDILELGLGADSIKISYHADEVTTSPISKK